MICYKTKPNQTNLSQPENNGIKEVRHAPDSPEQKL